MDSRAILKSLLVAGLSLVWIFAVYVAYYTVHKPFTASIVLAILDRIADLAIWLGLLLLAAALGHRLLRGLAFQSLLEELSLGTGLGLGLLSLITLGLGLLGLLHRWLFYGLAALAYLALFPEIKSILERLRRQNRPSFQSPLETLMAAYVFIVLSLALLTSLTPPVAWDSQVYHLTGPKLFIESGKIAGGIDIPYLGFPALVEMLFLAGVLLKGDIVPKLMHFGYGLLTTGLVYCFVCRFLRLRTRWLAPAIYLSVPSLVLVSTWAYVEMGLAFYSLAAFYGLIIWMDSRERNWLILAGIISGLALGVKYTALVTTLSLCLILIWQSRRGRIKGITHNLLSFGLAGAVAACPWYLRNWTFYGNPLYPFLFGGTYWDVFRAQWYSRWGTGMINEPLRLLVAPWDMTILGTEGKAGYAATIGPILLACLPIMSLMLLRKIAQRQNATAIAAAGLVCGISYLFWLCGVAISGLLEQTRLLIPIFPLLAVLVSVAVEELVTWDMKGFSLHRFTLMVLAATICLTAFSFFLSFVADNPLSNLLGLETRDQYLNNHLGNYYQAVSYINHDLPSSARVLFLWEPRSYYCQRECWPDAILDRFKHLTYKYGDAEGIAQYLHAQGITHVLFHKAGFDHILAAQFDPILPTDIEVLEELREIYLEPIWDIADSYLIYTVR